MLYRGIKADEVRHPVHVADAFGEGDCPGIGAHTQVAVRVALEARIARIRVVGVGVVQRRLVGQDKDAAKGGAELLHRRRVEGVAIEKILILFLDDLVARWRHRLDHILAGGQAD